MDYATDSFGIFVNDGTIDNLSKNNIVFIITNINRPIHKYLSIYSIILDILPLNTKLLKIQSTLLLLVLGIQVPKIYALL